MQLELDHVGMWFGTRRLFSDFSLVVRPGELVGVIGPSGAGKSTMLGILSGLVQPSRGRAVVSDGAHRSAMNPRLASWIPQGNNALPSRTVLDNAMLGSLSHGKSRDVAAEEATEALASVGLAALAKAQAATLSGGELQRLAIARAVCSRRPFLFADEPTGNLDRVNTELVVSLLREVVGASDIASVVATHDSVVAHHCSSIVDLETVE